MGDAEQCIHLTVGAAGDMGSTGSNAIELSSKGPADLSVKCHSDNFTADELAQSGAAPYVLEVLQAMAKDPDATSIDVQNAVLTAETLLANFANRRKETVDTSNEAVGVAQQAEIVRIIASKRASSVENVARTYPGGIVARACEFYKNDDGRGLTVTNGQFPYTTYEFTVPPSAEGGGLLVRRLQADFLPRIAKRLDAITAARNAGHPTTGALEENCEGGVPAGEVTAQAAVIAFLVSHLRDTASTNLTITDAVEPAAAETPAQPDTVQKLTDIMNAVWECPNVSLLASGGSAVSVESERGEWCSVTISAGTGVNFILSLTRDDKLSFKEKNGIPGALVNDPLAKALLGAFGKICESKP